VLGFGTYEPRKHPRIAIVLDGLRAHGDDVVEVNAPLRLSTEERVAMLRRPWLLHRLVRRLLRCWGRLVIGAVHARRRQPPDVVIVGFLGQFDVLLARLLFPRTTIVLDMLVFGGDTARDRGASGKIVLALLDLLDRIAVRAATIVMVDTDEQLRLLPRSGTNKGVVVPVGAPDTWFRAGATAQRPRDRLCVVFFGLYTPLQGAPVIGSALGQLADRRDIAVTMIGTGQDYAATRAAAAANDKVSWVDWVDADDLATTVAAHHVCLGIFGTTAKAMRVVPNKVYQGAAAGCAIVTSDTSAQRAMLGDAAEFVPAGDAAALAGTLRALADDPARVRSLGSAAHAAALARFGAAAIVEPLRRSLSDVTAARILSPTAADRP
jgi:glycosyltransferase involved in cell wall biosynthesis